MQETSGVALAMMCVQVKSLSHRKFKVRGKGMQIEEEATVLRKSHRSNVGRRESQKSVNQSVPAVARFPSFSHCRNPHSISPTQIGGGWVDQDGGKVEEERGGEEREADGSVCVDCTVG